MGLTRYEVEGGGGSIMVVRSQAVWSKLLGGVHKNRKDQILVMQGWRAESNKTWKTPLGISSPRTRSMLK